MKFKHKKASNWQFKEDIEINTIEELLEFMENRKCAIVLNHYRDIDEDYYEICDYDDCMD